MIEALLNKYGFHATKRDPVNNQTWFEHYYITPDNKIAGRCNKIRITPTEFSTYEFVMGEWDEWKKISATLTGVSAVFLYRPIKAPWWAAQQTQDISGLENYLKANYQIV